MKYLCIVAALLGAAASTTGCVSFSPDEFEADIGEIEQYTTAAPVPTSCSLEAVEDWCDVNGQGATPALGGQNNPCADMCGTVADSYHALAGAAASITSDILEATMNQWSLCLAATGIDVMALSDLWSSQWCTDNPIQCGISLVAGGVCAAQECFASELSTNPYVAALAAVCDIGPILGAAIERIGYCNQCIEHIENEISMPINPEQGCFCQRQEIWWGVFSNTNCGATHTWAQMGTAQANCVDHDSDWLAAASPACLGAGASHGDTFYRYSNCQFCTSDQPCWPAFQAAQQAFQNWINPPPPPEPVEEQAPELPAPPP